MSSRAPAWSLAAACLGTFTLLVNVSIVAVVLPEVARDLGAGFTALRWVIAAYSLALATLLLAAGSLADRIGHRRVFLLGLVSFLVASAVCGAAPDPAVLLAGRVGQGAAAAALFTSSLALIASAYPGEGRSRALGLWAATIGAATTLGPLLGGVIVEVSSWRGVFFVNVPLAAVGALIVVARVPSDPGGRGRPVDWPGQVLASAGLCALVFALAEGADAGWGEPEVLVPLAAGPLLLAAFVVRERRAAHPMLDLALVRRGPQAGAALAGFGLHASLFALIIFIAVYLQTVLGYTPLQTGLILVPHAAVSVLLGPLAGRLARRVAVRFRIAAGLGLIAVGIVLMRGLTADAEWPALMAGLVVSGAGVGLANPAIPAGALAGVERARSGVASAFNVTSRQLGTAVGVAGVGTLLQARAHARVDDLTAGGPLAGSEAAREASVGNAADALAQAPDGLEAAVLRAGDVAYAGALDDVLLASAAIAVLGAIAALALVRGAAVGRDPAAPEAPGGVAGEQRRSVERDEAGRARARARPARGLRRAGRPRGRRAG